MLFTRAQLKEVQDKLGVIFRNPQLLEQAFIHRSALNEAKKSDLEHNERMEFLGDAVLDLALKHYLYQRLPDASEGKLTAIRGVMASGKVLGNVAEEMGLDKFLVMSNGERKAFENKDLSRFTIMACAFEALVGAMYLDRGMGVVELFLGSCFFPKLREIIDRQIYLEPKSYFQEIAQEKWRLTPRYEVIEERGSQHEKVFIVAALADSRRVGEGTGASKSLAETEAARDALTKEFHITLSRY